MPAPAPDAAAPRHLFPGLPLGFEEPDSRLGLSRRALAMAAENPALGPLARGMAAWTWQRDPLSQGTCRLMLEAANAAALGRQGLVFCLAASAEEISARVAADPGAARPMLAGPDPMARLLALIREREGGYRRFAQIDTSGKTPAQVATELLTIIRAALACTPPA